MTNLHIALDDPTAPDVHALLEAHLAFARSVTPPEDVFALDPDARLDEKLSYFSARRGGALVGVGALREIDAHHGEIKSMHTAAGWRRRGLGRCMLDFLVVEARRRGYQRLSLETGPMEAFAPARAMYSAAGFEPTEPFAGYGPRSVCMTLRLDTKPI